MFLVFKQLLRGGGRGQACWKLLGRAPSFIQPPITPHFLLKSKKNDFFLKVKKSLASNGVNPKIFWFVCGLISDDYMHILFKMQFFQSLQWMHWIWTILCTSFSRPDFVRREVTISMMKNQMMKKKILLALFGISTNSWGCWGKSTKCHFTSWLTSKEKITTCVLDENEKKKIVQYELSSLYFTCHVIMDKRLLFGFEKLWFRKGYKAKRWRRTLYHYRPAANYKRNLIKNVSKILKYSIKNVLSLQTEQLQGCKPALLPWALQGMKRLWKQIPSISNLTVFNEMKLCKKKMSVCKTKTAISGPDFWWRRRSWGRLLAKQWGLAPFWRRAGTETPSSSKREAPCPGQLQF